MGLAKVGPRPDQMQGFGDDMMGFARRVRVPLLLVALLFAATTFGAAAAPSQPPDEFIRVLGKEAISSLTGPNVTTQERERRFRNLFTENFDVPNIGRFVLGLYWRRATPEQQTEYLKLFEDFIVKSYAKQFGDYSGDGIKTGQVIKVSNTETIVASTIKPNKQREPARLDWRVRTDDAHYKIVDVMVEGISMSVTHRDEFASVIQSKGGNVEGLLEALRKKTQ
jgi:phospholipid transport system substrate-binding protein